MQPKLVTTLSKYQEINSKNGLQTLDSKTSNKTRKLNTLDQAGPQRKSVRENKQNKENKVINRKTRLESASYSYQQQDSERTKPRTFRNYKRKTNAAKLTNSRLKARHGTKTTIIQPTTNKTKPKKKHRTAATRTKPTTELSQNAADNSNSEQNASQNDSENQSDKLKNAAIQRQQLDYETRLIRTRTRLGTQQLNYKTRRNQNSKNQTLRKNKNSA